MDHIQELLEGIIKAMVSIPDEVLIEKEIDEKGVRFSIWVDKRDMGLVVGSRGVNIEAIKQIFGILGQREKTNISIKLKEPKNYVN